MSVTFVKPKLIEVDDNLIERIVDYYNSNDRLKKYQMRSINSIRSVSIFDGFRLKNRVRLLFNGECYKFFNLEK